MSPTEYPYGRIRRCPEQRRNAGNQGTKQRKQYKDIIMAWDIETTRLPELDQSYMYIWQCAIYVPAYGGLEPLYACIVGRTWEEFDYFVGMLEHAAGDSWLVCWVHNLSFEFSFLRGRYRFEPDDVFAIKSRKVVKAMLRHIEFRCSYIHSNMSLDEYTSKMGVQHPKLTYDYDKIRYPWTELSESEIAYCINDVLGLVEAIMIEMRADGDNLYTIPLTSTGYVRRDAKHAMRAVSHSYIKSQLPDYKVYKRLREAFRGGDTHANRYFVGQTVYDCQSADRSSSYPDIVCNCKFPVGPFMEIDGQMDYKELLEYVELRNKAVICRCAITGIRLRDPFYPAPYIGKDKCRNLIGYDDPEGSIDNGRVLRARYLEITITDIDLRIIAREYTWDDIVFYDVAYSRYGPLPDALIAETIKYYRLKTELKGDPSQEVYYVKAKNKLNSIYGMMAQDPVKQSIIYTQDGQPDQYGYLDYYPLDTSKSPEELLETHNRKAFLVYQWGCWVTAWARYRLREAIWSALEQGAEFLYCDTDSIKYYGTVDWSDYNRQRVEDSKRSGAYATDAKGKTHYMGVLEQEEDMLAFKSFGAKKYCYVHLHRSGEPELISTIAGVAKSAGAEELCRHGGLAAFEPGFVFREAGGLEAIYNDDTDMELDIDGHKLRITANVTLKPSTYELGLAGEFERLLRFVRYSIDF